MVKSFGRRDLGHFEHGENDGRRGSPAGRVAPWAAAAYLAAMISVSAKKKLDSRCAFSSESLAWMAFDSLLTA